MLKTVLAGTAALVIAGSSLVYAQQSSDGDHHWRPSAADFAAFTDARVAALKAGLKLTPDQEKSWPAFEQAFRDLAKLRADRIAARMAQHKDGDHADNVDPIDRLERRADALSARGTALKHLADAAKPLYQSLDDGQKHRFIMLARVMHREHREHMAWREHEHEHGHEHGNQQ
jgi:zinc resistance-associated protein